MPELPEVELTARFLRDILVGRSLRAIKVTWPRTIDRPTPRRFASALRNAEVRTVGRRGKYIVIEIAAPVGGQTRVSFLLCHLRMSGSWRVAGVGERRGRHEHVSFVLSDGTDLRFRDPRKFGRFYLVDSADEVVGKLGPEPLAAEFSAENFEKALASKRSAIKGVLLDQRIVAGIGNIYADEALWRAKIHPLTQASRLRRAEVAELRRAIIAVLGEAIDNRGTDNGDGVIDGGGYDPQAYGRTALACLRCTSALKTIRVLQRSSTFCPRCQKKRR